MFDKLFWSACAVAALALPATLAQAQGAAGFPSKPVKLIVAAAAGSSPDAIGRRLSTKLGAMWNQPVLIENVVGLGGITGAERAAKQPADGYTYAVNTIGAMSVSGSLMPLPYDPVKDFEPVSLLMQMPNLLVVHPSVPANNLRELIAYVKQNPGKLRYGHPGVGTSNHLSGELLNQMAGINMQGVPYKSSAQMMTDLLAGHYEVLFHNSSVVLPHAQTGKARILGITGLQRSAALPDVPTVAEAGFAGYDIPIWTALMAPKGTPAPVLAKLRAAVGEILQDRENVQKMHKLGLEPGDTDGAALSKRISSDIARWRRVAKAANIQPQ